MRGPSVDDHDRRRARALVGAARRIVIDAGSLSDDELLATIAQLRVGRVLAGPLSFLAGAVLLVLHGIVLLLTNWRLLVLELIPAIWIAAVLWDWRFHVVEGHELTELHGGWAIAIAAFVVLATMASYWCNIAFTYSALDHRMRLQDAARKASGHARLVATAALGVGLLHAWVSVRGPVKGLPTVTVGLGLVALLNLYLYTALPAQALGLRRQRPSPTQYVAKTVTSGAVSMVVSLPGLLLALLAHALLGVTVLRALGVVVLAVAVVLQVAAASSSRAVSMSAQILAHQSSSGSSDESRRGQRSTDASGRRAAPPSDESARSN